MTAKLGNLAIALLLALIVSVTTTIVFATLWNYERARANVFSDAARCRQVLLDLGPRYKNVHAVISTDARVIVKGGVELEADRGKLDDAITDALGNDRSAKIRFQVGIGQK